jgi:hypothetical protein
MRPRFLALGLGLGLAALLAAGCGFVFGKDASLSSMVPGGNLMDGELECWLTLEFEKYPEGVDPRDVSVRFASEALAVPAEFDWSYIAEKDMVAKGMQAGNQWNKETSADAAPPLHEPLKVKFPLMAKRQIEKRVGSTIWLEAELWWGGKKQDSVKRAIDHMYQYES